MRRRKMKLLAGVKTNTLLAGLAGATVLYFLIRKKDLNGFGVPGRPPSIVGDCLDEWFALQRRMKGRMGTRGGGRVSPGLATFPVMPTGEWLARCVARKTPIGYGIPTIMPFYGGAYGKKLSSEAHCAAIKVKIEQGKGQYNHRNIYRQEARFCTEAKREKKEYDALYGTGEEDAFQQQTDELMRQFQDQQEQPQNGATGGGMGLMWPLVGLGVLGSLGVVGIILVGGKKKKKKKKRKKR